MLGLALPERLEPVLDKTAVVEALRLALREELDAIERVAAMARDEVSSEETKSEGKYDTRATEASYLARGQAWRVASMRKLRAWFDVFDTELSREEVGLGSLVRVAGHREGWFFLAPSGGPQVTVAGKLVRVISPSSPLGKAMQELEADDAFEVQSPQGVVEYEILRVL